MIQLTRVLLAIILISTSQITFAENPTYVGILESFNQKQWSEQTQKNSLNPRVRIVFEKEGQHWRAMKNDFDSFDALTQSSKYYPNKVDWNVIYHGKNLGDLTTEKFSPQWYSDVGIQKIVGKLSNNFLITPSKNLQFSIMKLNYKPLITITTHSSNRYKDWMISKPTEDEIKQILNQLKLTSAKKIQILEGYRSKDHGFLLNVRIKNTAKYAWFYFAKDSTVKSLGDGLHLIDFEDIDNDGKSEFLFLYNDPAVENTNGYILFSDDFNQSAKFMWHYH